MTESHYFTAAAPAAAQHAAQSIRHSGQPSQTGAQAAHGVAQHDAFFTVADTFTRAAGPATARATSSQHGPGQQAAPGAQQDAFTATVFVASQHGPGQQAAPGAQHESFATVATFAESQHDTFAVTLLAQHAASVVESS
jgi:hypothetical protein